MELEFQEIEFHVKKNFISVIAPYSVSPIVAFLSPIVTFSSPIVAFSCEKFFLSAIALFWEPYSGVFKAYSDVLGSYSSVFLQKIFLSPHNRFMGPYSGIFKPYCDVLELDFPKIDFHAFFFFFLSFIWHNSIFYESSISLKLDFKLIEYRNCGIFLYSFKIGTYC